MFWSVSDIPSQYGRVAVVTGANGGLGLASARVLASKGAHVVMAARNQDKASSAKDAILRSFPEATLEVVPLDLGSLKSVEAAARAITDGHERVDLLIANAGVMAMPRGTTEDGFETQLGINHLGHWALVSHLLPTIVRTEGARVVTLTSTAQHLGRPVDADDPHLRRRYDAWSAYGRSKLAMRHFAQGLHHQFEAAGVNAKALTAHPGLTHSDLQATSVEAGGAGVLGRIFHAWTAVGGMSIEQGALSQLRAATDPDARSGTMYGPLFGTNGPPVCRPLLRPGSADAIARLWEVSRRETGLDVDVTAALRAA